MVYIRDPNNGKARVASVCAVLPGPQTVDLMPVCSRTGTLLTAPSMCCMNTSQSRSNRLKANLSDTWEIKTHVCGGFDF